MDNMEASVPENGLFYSRLGNKSGDGKTDDRIFILTEGRKTAEGRFEYAIITEKGPMKLNLDTEFDILSLMAKGGNIVRYTGGDSSKLLPIGDADQDFLSEAMTKSIEKSRATSENARNKAALEAEKKKQATGEKLSNLFNQAIKPPIGEGPTAPPSSPTAPTV